MERLKNMINNKIGIYIRKERASENMSTGYGRLQWLKYELENHKGTINVYIDEEKESNKFNKLIKDIEERKIEVLLIWNTEEFENNEFIRIINMCVFSQVEIISFCQKMMSIKEITECYPYK